MAARKLRLLGVGILAAALGGSYLARNQLGIEWSVDSLRELVDGMGLWGPGVMVLLVAFRTSLLLPSQLVLLASGLIFGTVDGTIVGGLGLILSGTLYFSVARWLGGDVIRNQVPAGLRRTLEMASSRGGATLLGVATAYPVGILAAYHAAAGLTRMSFAVFWLALVPSCFIRAWLYAYFASSVAEGRWNHVAIATAIFGALMLPLAHPRVRAIVKRQFQIG